MSNNNLWITFLSFRLHSRYIIQLLLEALLIIKAMQKETKKDSSDPAHLSSQSQSWLLNAP